MVVLIPSPKVAHRSLEELVKKTQELAQKSENVYLDHPHAKERMVERHVSIQQVFDVLRHGKGVDGPKLDKYGCWRIKLERFSAGHSVQVVVVVKEQHLEVITVISKTRKHV